MTNFFVFFLNFLLTTVGRCLMSNFEQLFGHGAVGAAVARDFGELGTFTGRVVKFVRGKGKIKGLYTAEYEDRDVEDMDTEK